MSTAVATLPEKKINLAKFKPTKSMLDFAETIIQGIPQPDGKRLKPESLTQTCEAVGINRSTYYKWKKTKAEFIPWLRECIAEESSLMVHNNIASAARRNDQEVNLPACRLYLALFENWSERVVIEQHSTLTIEVGDNLGEALTAARALQPSVDDADCIDVTPKD